MKLGVGNLYIGKHSSGYAVHIEMPDGSRNYLHCEPMSLIHAITIKDNLTDYEIVWSDIEITKHPKYPKYYRINLPAKTATQKVNFHSRALNLTDVVFERMQLLVAED